MNTYTNQDIEVILQLSGITAWSSSLQTTGSMDGYTLNYSMQKITEFLSSKQLKLHSYCVAIINHDGNKRYAIILQYKDNALQVHLMLPEKDGAFIESIGEEIHTAFNIQSDLDVQFTENLTDAVFTEYICLMLTERRTQPLDPNQVAAKHHELCLQALLSTTLSDELIREALILSKHITLQQQRKQQFTNFSDSAIASTLTEDKKLQKAIFQNDIREPSEIFACYPFSILSNLIYLNDNEKRILEIKYLQQRYQCDIQNWQTLLKIRLIQYQQHFGNRVRILMSNLANFIYQSGFIGIGAGLFEWLANTLSSRLSRRAREATHLILTAERLSKLAKVMGALLGALLTLSFDWYSIFYLFVSQLGTQTLHGYLLNEKINIRQASVTSREKMRLMPSKSTLLRFTSLLVAAASSYWTQDNRYLVYGLGGVAVSFGFEKYGDFLLNQLKKELPLSANIRSYIRFFVSTAGLYLGHLLAFYYHLFITKKIIARESVLISLKQMQQSNNTNIHYFQAHFPRVRYTPSMWFTSSNPMTLFWTGAKHAYIEECQIKLDSNDIKGIVDCHRISTTHLLSGST